MKATMVNKYNNVCIFNNSMSVTLTDYCELEEQIVPIVDSTGELLMILEQVEDNGM